MAGWHGKMMPGVMSEFKGKSHVQNWPWSYLIVVMLFHRLTVNKIAQDIAQGATEKSISVAMAIEKFPYFNIYIDRYRI